MAISKSPEPTNFRTGIVVAGVGVGLVAVVVILTWLYWPTPQMGADREVFDTVDALFTAVTGRSEERLTDCERRLHAYREEGKLAPAAAAQLDAIIRKARSGGWDSAARSLYAFMRAQRRDGPLESPTRGRQRKSN